MKRVFVLLLLFFFIRTLSAQQYSEKEYAKHLKKLKSSTQDGTALVSLDTLYNKGEVVALFKKVAGSDQDYSVKNLSGNELIYYRFNSYDEANHTDNIGSVQKNYYYEVIFPALKKRCEVEFKTPQQLGEFVISRDLIESDHLKISAVDILLSEYGDKFSDNRNKPLEVFYDDKVGKNYQLIQRDKTKMIIINNQFIEQDNKTIGTIETKMKEEGAVTLYNYTIKLADGTLIATAKHQNLGTEDIEIKTLRDNQVIRISKPTYWIDKTIAQYLIDNGYL